LFRDDNASLHHYLKDATRSTAYAAFIKLFQRRKDGRRALLALINPYAGNNKWEAEVTNQHSRVGFSLDAIQSNDAGLQAAIVIVRTDDGPIGMRNDFEAAASHLLPYNPVAKKRLTRTKRGVGMTSSVMDIANGCPMSARWLLTLLRGEEP
jgi:hypothetical protein